MPRTRKSTKRLWLMAAAMLALVATCVSAYLSWLAIGHGQSALGCTGTVLGCDEVLGSRWSVALGLPVSVLGTALYAVVLVILLLLAFAPGERLRNQLRMPLIAAVTMAVGAALWFILVQMFALRAFCPYCMTIHACGAILALFVFLGLPRVDSRSDDSARRALLMVSQPSRSTGTVPSVPTQPAPRATVGVAIGMGLLALFIAAQIVAPPASYQEEQFTDVAQATDDAPSPAGASPSTALPPAASPSTNKDTVPPVAEETSEAASAKAAGNDARNDAASASGEPSSGPKDTTSIEEDLAFLSADPVDQPLEQPQSETSQTAAGGEPSQPADGGRKLRLLGGKLTLDMKDHKLIGSPDAPHVMVKLFDYTCPHCLDLDHQLEKARQRYGDQLAIVLVNVPMNTRCNPYVNYTAREHRSACLVARLADAVWRERPDKFEEYHRWMFAGDKPRQAGDVRRYVERLLGD